MEPPPLGLLGGPSCYASVRLLRARKVQRLALTCTTELLGGPGLGTPRGQIWTASEQNPTRTVNHSSTI